MSETAKCPRCNGEGLVTVIGYVEFLPTQEAEPCPECNGDGEVEGYDCAIHGEGVGRDCPRC